MNRGYVKLFRKMRENELWTEKRVFSRAEAWLDLLMEAHHSEEPKTVLIKNKAYTVGFGQVLWSFRFMAKRWRWSLSAVVRFLDLLKNRNSIETESGTALTPITICNYKKYYEFGNNKRNSCETETGTMLKQFWNKKKNVRIKEEKNIGSAKADPLCATTAILDLYREILPHHPGISEITNTLKKTLNERCREHPSIEWWKNYFDRVSQSKFLTGKKTDFIASFPWLIGPKNMAKVLGGQYDDQIKRGNGGMDGILSDRGQQNLQNAQDYLRRKRQRREETESPDCSG